LEKVLSLSSKADPAAAVAAAAAALCELKDAGEYSVAGVEDVNALKGFVFRSVAGDACDEKDTVVLSLMLLPLLSMSTCSSCSILVSSIDTDKQELSA
jgi:hypothetical protein